MSYNNILYASKSLANRVWGAIKDDKQLRAIIRDPEQIRFVSPKEAAEKPPQISIYLYNVTEMASMRNQPTPSQNPSKPPLYLSLRYIITPLTDKVEDDQVLLGKIMHAFHETPILRTSNLYGPLSETGEELKVMLDPLSFEDSSKIWGMLEAPYRLSVGYTVQPVTIGDIVKPTEKLVIIRQTTTTIPTKIVKA